MRSLGACGAARVLIAVGVALASGAARATIELEMTTNGTYVQGFTGPNQYFSGYAGPFEGSSTYTRPNFPDQNATSQAVANPATGHIGVLFDAHNGVSTDAYGQLGYTIRMDAGDSLLVGFAASGSVTGHAWAVASIVDRGGNSGLNYSVLCTADDGCSQPLAATFSITATFDDEIFEIVPSLDAYTTLTDPASGADWFHSLSVSFTAPPGSDVIDSIGIIQTPEPGSAVLIGSALAGVAATHRRRAATPA